MKLKRTGALLLVLLMVFSFAAAETGETVSFRNVTVSKDAEYVDLGKIGIQDNQWEKFYAFLAELPNLKKIDMYNTVINLKVWNRLNEQFPDVEFGVQFRYGRHKETFL